MNKKAKCGCCGLPVAECMEIDFEDYEDHPDTIFGAGPGSRYGS